MTVSPVSPKLGLCDQLLLTEMFMLFFRPMEDSLAKGLHCYIEIQGLRS